MRIFANELRKVCTKPIFLLIVFTLLIANGVIVGNQRTEYEELYNGSREAYRQAYEDYQGSTPERVGQSVAKRLEKLEIYRRLDLYYAALAEGSDGPRLPDTLTPEMLKRYHEGNYLVYSDSIDAECRLFAEIQKECERCASYPEYIVSIGERAEQMMSVSLFSKHMSAFEGENVIRTPLDFEAVADVKPVVDISFGVQKFSDSLLTDLFLFFFVFTVCSMLFLGGEIKELRHLTYPTVNGRVPLVLAKFGVAVLLVLAGVLAFEGENLLILGSAYSFGDLARPIQSVTGFQTCNLPVSVLQYLVMTVGMKCLMFLFAASFVAICCVFFRSAAPIYFVTAVVAAASVLCTLFIAPNSYLNLFRFLNPVNAVYLHGVLSSYQNINLFGKAINLLPAVISVYASLLVLFTAGTVWGFCRNKAGISFGKHLAFLMKALRRRLCGRCGQSSVFVHESHKLLVSERAGLALILLVLLQVSFFNKNDFLPYVLSEDLVMQSICQDITGGDSPENDAKIEKLVSHNEKVGVKLAELGDQYMNGELEKDEFEKRSAALESSRIPGNVMSRLLMMQQNVKENNAEYIYDGSYRMFLEFFHHEEQLNLTASFALILLLAAVFCREHTAGMDSLITATKNGRGRVFMSKLSLSVILTMMVWAACYIPQMVLYLNAYGSPLHDAPVNSILILSKVRLPLSITGAIVLDYSLKLLGLLGITITILAVSQKSRMLLMVLLTSTAVVMIPQLLALLGIQWIDYVTFNSALYFPRVMQDIGNSAFSQMQSFYFIVYIAALLLLCFVLIRFLYRNLVVSKKESALWTKRANRKEQKA